MLCHTMILGLLIGGAAAQTTIEYQYLKPNITVLTYTPEQRIQVANTMKTLLSVFQTN